MIRRTTRGDQQVDHEALLATIGTCRKAVIDEQTKADIGGVLYYACTMATAGIDGLALVLTGQKEYFWLKAHSIGGSG